MGKRRESCMQRDTTTRTLPFSCFSDFRPSPITRTIFILEPLTKWASQGNRAFPLQARKTKQASEEGRYSLTPFRGQISRLKADPFRQWLLPILQNILLERQFNLLRIGAC